MSEYRVASRYAKSLLSLAIERKELDEVERDMALFLKVADESRDLRLLLKNPIVSHDKKLQVLNLIFSKKVGKTVNAFLTLITKKNRESMLYAIAKEFKNQYNIYKGIELVNLTTAVPLADGLRKEFSKLIEKGIGKTVDLKEEVDQDLIGGFVLRVDNKQLDNSVKTSLEKIRRQLIHKN